MPEIKRGISESFLPLMETYTGKEKTHSGECGMTYLIGSLDTLQGSTISMCRFSTTTSVQIL